LWKRDPLSWPALTGFETRQDSLSRKILFLADSLVYGGAERQLTLLATHLPSEWEPKVFTLGDGPFTAELRRVGVDTHVSPRRWRFDVLPALSLWRLIRSWHPDVVHSYGYMGTLAALLPCKWLRIPLVDGTIRTATVPKKRGRIWQWTLQHGNRVIANSEAGLKAFRINPARGRLVYNGFDPERLQLCTPEINAGNHAEPFRVAMAARMSPVKDYDLFIQAARLLTRGEQGAWQFLAIGDGPTRASLVEGAADLIARNVLGFPQEEMEVLPYVRHSDVGVLLTAPGVHEGCSNSIMEYMACGLPVVCSDSGGNRELVLEGVTGFIVPPRDVNALVDKLIWLRTHPQEAQVMGAAARQRLLKEFTVEKLVENTLAVYAEVLPSASHFDRRQATRRTATG
jgi:glycosyltransferase involved in cell wall biosynthesis